MIQNTEFSHLMVRSTIELTAEWNKKWKCFVVKEVTDDSECKNSTWHERPIKIVQCIINEKITQTSQSLIPPWRPCNGSLRPRVDILTLFLVLIGDKNKLNPALTTAELHLHWSQEVGHFNSWYICLCVQASSYTCRPYRSI